MVANQPTPWMGVFARINIFAYMLWVAPLACSSGVPTKSQLNLPEVGDQEKRVDERRSVPFLHVF